MWVNKIRISCSDQEWRNCVGSLEIQWYSKRQKEVMMWKKSSLQQISESRVLYTDPLWMFFFYEFSLINVIIQKQWYMYNSLLGFLSLHPLISKCIFKIIGDSKYRVNYIFWRLPINSFWSHQFVEKWDSDCIFSHYKSES